MMRRRTLLAGMLAVLPLVASPALAKSPPKEGEQKEKKDKEKPAPLPQAANGERYIKLPPIVLELWDRNGVFHLSSVDFVLIASDDTKLAEKNLSDKMRKVLNGISYEEYTATNPAPFMKDTMLDLIRKQPGGEKVKEVLISKMLFR
jgi:hypothetical protein